MVNLYVINTTLITSLTDNRESVTNDVESDSKY